MKKLFILTLAITLAAGLTGYADFLENGTKIVRTDATYDPDFGPDGAWGTEIGVGSTVFPLDDLGIVGGYRSESDTTLLSLGVYAEEHYVTSTPLIPFIGAGAGYAWLNADTGDGDDDRAFTLRFEGGVKVLLSEGLALSATAVFSWADTDIFPTRTDRRETDLNYNLGLRFYY
jgi:opacity protein-like surface antigen